MTYYIYFVNEAIGTIINKKPNARWLSIPEAINLHSEGKLPMLIPQFYALIRTTFLGLNTGTSLKALSKVI
jgi:hypothetical protein